MRSLFKYILTLLLFSTVALATVPNHINFHSMVYDDSGNPVINTTISLRIEILNADGTVLYSETSNAITTDAKGIVSLKIGTLTSSGTFSTLDFDKAKYIHIWRDLTGGNSYTTVALQELSSTPFALTAKKLSGYETSATGSFAQALGYNTKAPSPGSFAMGNNTTASGVYSTAMGLNTTAIGSNSIATGYGTTASGYASTAMGSDTNASGDYSTAMGYDTTASKSGAMAWGGYYDGSNFYKGGTASGLGSTAWGVETLASGKGSTAMGGNTTASGLFSTASGTYSTAWGETSTAMGYFTNASGNYSTAMGDDTFASGLGSTAMGGRTTASSSYSTAMGESTTASASNSTAIGFGTVADQLNMTAVGKYNTAGLTSALFVVGNGFSDSQRSNAFIVYSTGNAILNGSLTQSSDRRLKTNITPVNNAIEKVKAINGVNYNWIDPNKDQSLQMGVIAQEVQAVMPELVDEREDGYLSVNYSGMNGVLVEAIKEQQKEIEQQQGKIEKLETRLEKLEKLLTKQAQ